jgi:hypothetical protein
MFYAFLVTANAAYLGLLTYSLAVLWRKRHLVFLG